LSMAAKDVLERLRTARQEKALADGVEAPAWVFATDAGTPFDHGRVGKVFKRVLRAAKLPGYFSPHSLRHTFASLLLQQGESPAYVQRPLGHASIKLTVDTYGRWLPMGNKAAVDRLDEGFVTPDDAAGSRLVATAAPRRGRHPQAIEKVVRPGRFERPTYRFVVCRSIQLS
jgi:integrase